MSRRRRGLALALLLVTSLAACGEPSTQAEAGGDDDARARELRARQAAEAEEVGFPVQVTNDLGMRFRLLPRGAFVMGTPDDAAGHAEDETAHEVHFVTPAYLQTTEVTNALFRAFRPDHQSGTTADGSSLDEDDLPVVNVTHADAVAFCRWLEARDPRWRYRLPTEAEWEYACRLGGEVESPPPADLVTAHEGRPASRPEPVGGRSPNAWGYHDLLGNVAEWCHDRYGPYPSWRQDNPQGATTGSEHVVRGGAWRDGPKRVVASRREHHPPQHRSDRVGFRVAMGLGYARHEFGRHEVRFRTVDPTVSADVDRPGYALRMISVVDRLTDRQNAPDQRPRWTDIPLPSPTTVHLAPGRYYVYAHRTRDGVYERGLEVKFDVPERDAIDVPVPRSDQHAPQ